MSVGSMAACCLQIVCAMTAFYAKYIEINQLLLSTIASTILVMDSRSTHSESVYSSHFEFRYCACVHRIACGGCLCERTKQTRTITALNELQWISKLICSRFNYLRQWCLRISIERAPPAEHHFRWAGSALLYCRFQVSGLSCRRFTVNPV